MAVAAYDQVVVDGNSEWPGRIRDHPGHVDIGPRGRGVARGVVVHQATITPYPAERTLKIRCWTVGWEQQLGTVLRDME